MNALDILTELGKPENITLLEAATKEWGVESQEDMCIEEAAELIVAICHKRRERTAALDILEECVDSMLTAFQQVLVLEQRYGMHIYDEYSRLLNKKLERLERRVREGHLNGN
ncbi:MAG: hypothetical protein OEX12_00340 [Gammaproteobacteria bacterium]|nr:hypothetical protein [Gammaproteobacteria bacterium]